MVRRLEHQTIKLGGRTVGYRIIRSKAARRLRLRVGLNGVDVVRPASRRVSDVVDFLQDNENWLTEQLDRIQRLQPIRNTRHLNTSEILFRGNRTTVRVESHTERLGNKVVLEDSCIIIRRGVKSHTPAARTLENWLRKQARGEIERLLIPVTDRLKRVPNRVYVMGQRTKWGNCSPKRNLSFNWRLVLAPEFILRYFVTHEVVHLAVPNHSPKFWLTVQSICPQMQKARQWLRAHAHLLMENLNTVCNEVR